MINSRPLGVINDNINDPDACISPNSICHGRELTNLPFDRQRLSELPDDCKSFTRLQLHRRNLTIQAFKKWRKNYLFLTNVNRITQPGEPSPLKPGLVVLLKSDSGIQGKSQRWTLAKVQSCPPSSDGFIRRVSLFTPKGKTITRHVSHISLLPTTIRDIYEERERKKKIDQNKTSPPSTSAT